MKRNYEYGFIDGSIILARNFHAMKPFLKNFDYGAEQLAKSVLQSILKIAREKLQCERYFLLWDKKPYWKTEILKKDVGKSEYKTDRPKESEDLSKKLGGAKMLLMCNLGKLGITSIQYQGWEADDLAYLATRQCKTRDKKSVLISFDSDWMSWVGPMTDYYNIQKNSVYTYEHVINTHPPIKGLSLFQSKSWRDSLRGSHNNLKQTVKSEFKSVPSIKLIKAYESGNYEMFTDPNLLAAQLHTFDFSQYPDFEEVSNFLSSALKSGSVATVEELSSVLKDMNLKSTSISKQSYQKYLDRLNLDQWKR